MQVACPQPHAPQAVVTTGMCPADVGSAEAWSHPAVAPAHLSLDLEHVPGEAEPRRLCSLSKVAAGGWAPGHLRRALQQAEAALLAMAAEMSWLVLAGPCAEVVLCP